MTKIYIKTDPAHTSYQTVRDSNGFAVECDGDEAYQAYDKGSAVAYDGMHAVFRSHGPAKKFADGLKRRIFGDGTIKPCYWVNGPEGFVVHVNSGKKAE